MKLQTHPNLNKTGIQHAPDPLRRSNPDQSRNSSSEGVDRIAEARANYAAEAEPVGSIPSRTGPPQGLDSTPGGPSDPRFEVLIDKLGERLAFERISTRLYEAFLSKLRTDSDQLPKVSRDKLGRFRDEKVRHFNLVADAMDRISADATAQTPSADVTGVASLGLLQVVDDPRTTPAQCLEVLQTAELTDEAGWELLIELALVLGEDEMAVEFHGALQEERHHLAMIEHWYDEAIMGELD